jgi:hypothetical protein
LKRNRKLRRSKCRWENITVDIREENSSVELRLLAQDRLKRMALVISVARLWVCTILGLSEVFLLRFPNLFAICIHTFKYNW